MMDESLHIMVACLTPPGVGGIATIGLRGQGAWQLIEPFFQPRSHRSETVLLGRFGHEQTDDVVVTRAGDSVEIHCHGGIAVVRWILELLGQRGALEVSWEQWLRRATPRPVQAEAEIALAHALTTRTAGIILDQLHGALARALEDVLDSLQAADLPAARTQLQALVGQALAGRHLTQPWRVVLTGAANVGKSSLANAILGYQRSITSPIPGTTRDAVTALTAIEGWPVEIVDTAGLREAETDLEAAGIEKTHQQIAMADLELRILDRSVPPQLPHFRGEAGITRCLTVVNKIDLPAAWQPEGIPVSARTGEGLGELLHALAGSLVREAPGPGQAVPFTPALCDAVEAAVAALGRGEPEGAASLLRPLVNRAGGAG
jgi:tRNA modification GTPase